MGETVRRLLSTIAAMAVAGMIIPATAGGSVAKAAVAPPRFGLRLVDVPVSEAHNPRGLRYIIDSLAPGTVIHRRILIENLENQKSHFTVYPDAARIRHGSFIGDAGRTRSELTGWISLQHRSVRLQPGMSVLDMVTIRVPRVATRGEHYGVIWVQQVAHVRSARGVAVTEVNRVGIRIYLEISRGGAPRTYFAITAITGHRSPRGRPLLTARVTNTGGRAVDVSGTARLTAGPGGASAGPFQVQRVITLAPGQSDAVSFALPARLPTGPWLARITLTSGLTKRTASATVQFSAHAATVAWTRVAEMTSAGVLGLAMLAMSAFWVRRRGLLARLTAPGQ
jgi:hypothetical protein